jgi:outer membrane protein assembly factor BamD (BamD/ComL family)
MNTSRINLLRNLVLFLTGLTLLHPPLQSRTLDTESRREQHSTENKGQEQTQTAEAQDLYAAAKDLYNKKNFDEALTNISRPPR